MLEVWAQAQLIALVLMVAIVLTFSVGLLSFFNYHYSRIESERARVAYLSSIPASITVIPVYSGRNGDIRCHIVEVMNTGSSALTVWAAFGGGYLDERGYPKLDPSHVILKAIIAKARDGILEIPECPGDLEGYHVTDTLPISRIYTVDNWNLEELGNPRDYTLKGFTKLPLKPGESRTFYVVSNATPGTRGFESQTLVFIMGVYNDRFYLVATYKLPS